MRLVGNNTKIKSMLGWQQKFNLGKGLTETIKYYKNESLKKN